MKRHETTKTLTSPRSIKEATIAKNLNEYTEGDEEFLIEFAQNILDNISHLRTELTSTVEAKSDTEWSELTHMVKPTLEILGEDKILKGLMQMRSGDLNREDLALILESIDKTLEILENIIKRASQHALTQH